MFENQSSGTVLFVEEDEELVSSLQRIFAGEDGAFIYCTSIGEALEVLRNQPVDVVATDVRLWDEDGVAFLQRAESLLEATHTIVFASSSELDTVMELLTGGYADQHLLMPWRESELRTVIRDALRLQRQLKVDRLQEVLRTFNNLPSSLHFRNRIGSLLESDECSVLEVTQEVEQDPALLAMVLRIANSVAIGASRQITSARDALVLLGVQHVRTLVALAEYQQAIRSIVARRTAHHVEAFWLQAIRRSMIAKRLCTVWEDIPDPSLVHLAALFLDIGYLVRMCTEQERYEEMLQLSNTECISQFHADLLLFSIPHDQVGGALLELWNFPREVIFAVANHHGDSFGNALTQLVQVADALVSPEPSGPYDHAVQSIINSWKATLAAESVSDAPELPADSAQG
jgi:HD-like signal output (HDOD) protein/CheY-like chemotaxis protein